jgi:hypothetical protein
MFEVRNSANQLFPVGPNDPCLPPGDYVITVTDPPPTGRSYSWSLNHVVDNRPDVNGVNRNAYSLPITTGSTNTVSVSVETPNCDTPVPDSVELRACGKDETCPRVVWNHNVSDICTGNTREVDVTASVSSFGTPVTAELRDPQGTVRDTGTTTANGTVILSFGPSPLASGNHRFSVVFTSGLPPECDDTHDVLVPVCDVVPPPSDPLCIVLELL